MPRVRLRVSPVILMLALLASALSMAPAAARTGAVFDVRDTGAVGDGRTDDTAAIQRAIDAAAGGGTVVLPAGTYLVSSISGWPYALRIPSGVTIEGVGPSSVVKLADGSGDLRVFSTGYGREAGGTHDVAFRNFKIDGNRTAGGFPSGHEQSHGIFIWDGGEGNAPASNVTIQGMTITGMQGDGIFLYRSVVGATVTDNTITNNYRAAINAEVARDSLIARNTLSSNNAGIHIEMDTPGTVNSGNVIRDNIISNSNNGILLNGGRGEFDNVVVAGNSIVAPSGGVRIGDGTQTGSGIALYGIVIANSNGAVVQNNRIDDWRSNPAIVMWHGNSDLTIDGNTIVGFGGWGSDLSAPIVVGGSVRSDRNRNIAIRGNRIDSSVGGIGIYTNNGQRPEDVWVVGNIMTNIATAPAIQSHDVAGALTIQDNIAVMHPSYSGWYAVQLDPLAGVGGIDYAVVEGNQTEMNAGHAHVGIRGVDTAVVRGNLAYGSLRAILDAGAGATVVDEANLWLDGSPAAGPVPGGIPVPGPVAPLADTPPTDRTPPPTSTPGPVAFTAGTAEMAGFAESAQIAFVDTTNGLWKVLTGTGSVETFFYGVPGDMPLLGDWDCDGTPTPGVFRPAEGFVHLRNSTSGGLAEAAFYFGDSGDVPLVGDWDGDGCETLGVYRVREGRVYLRNRLGSGPAEAGFFFGSPGDRPFAGDFNGDGRDDVGVYRDSTGMVYLRVSLSSGVADRIFFYGQPADRVFAGDWDGDGRDTIGVYRATTGTAYLRNANDQGPAAVEMPVGSGSLTPAA